MAAAVSIYSPAQIPVEPILQDKTYLQLCLDEMSPSFSNNVWMENTVKKVSAYGILAIYTIAAVGAFVAVGILFPAYLPVASVSALLGCAFALKGHMKFKSEADVAEQRYEQLNQTKRHIQDLTSLTTEQLRNTLCNMGINWYQVPFLTQNTENVKELIPLLGRDRYLQNYMTVLEAQRQAQLAEAQKLSAGTPELFELHRAKIYELITGSMECEKAAAEAKLKSAFVRAVIQRPATKGNLDNVGTVSPLIPQERIAGNAIDDAAANQMFTFRNRALAPLTADEVKRLDVNQLAQRLLAAMPV